MPNPKPASVMAWATTPPTGALLEPPSALVTNGYSQNSKPAYNHFNWLLSNVGQWLAYLSTIEQVLYGPSNPPPAAAWSSLTGLPADLAYFDKPQVFIATQIFGPAGTADDKTGAPLQATSISEGGSLLADKYAPMNGSPNYAPATGSAAYAPASGSPNYAPASDSPNYAPAMGSSAYAPASGSPNYAPAVGSTAYAPASGSPNYAPVTGSVAYAPAAGSSNYAPATASQQASNPSDGSLIAGQNGNTLSEDLWAPAAGTYLINWTILLSSNNGAMAILTYLMTRPANGSTYTQLTAKAQVSATASVFNVVVSGSYIVTLGKGDLIYIAGDDTGGETIDILAGSYISAIRIA